MTLQLPAKARIYAPRGAALELLRNHDGELMLDGPAGTGKSRASLEKLNALAEKYPGSRHAIVRKTRASITETALVTFEQHVKPRCDTANQQRRVRQSYVYPNGSEIIVAGLDNPVKLMSSEFDTIYVMEATEATLNDWEFLTTRLRNGNMPYQQLFGDCNPGAPSHWLNRRMQAGMTTRLLSRHTDNPRLYAADGTLTEFGRSYLGRLDKLTGPRRERLLFGKWAAAEGMIYTDWREDVHHIDPFPIPPDWRRFLSIDFGFIHPFVCGWWAISPDGAMYLYREIYMTRRTVYDHAQTIKAHSAGEWYEAIVTDHDAEDRATLEQVLGQQTTPADKRVLSGIQAVQERLNPLEGPKPRLYVMRGSLVERDPALVDSETGLANGPTCTVEEIDGYVWDKKPNGETLKEKPVKQGDDGMDMLRYAVMYANNNGRPMFGVALEGTR
ncbi:phage terminase large subunit [Deinococcus lacus]|uniref:Phage terminase large subunit n=1 Tax=Deinococcus lacus TaxID=392561 RepID=A0ABW1YBS6_9DEIO